MKLLKIFSGKPLKRAELKAHSDDSKIRVRASRTGGVNAAYHPLRGLTFSTKYGMRASKTFKGLTLGFQGGNTVVRGRWSTKNQLLNLNLSKSGFSVSSKSEYGTYNFTHPYRSSFKFAGIQLRGKKAAGPAFFFTLLTLIPYIFSFVFNLLTLSFRITLFILRVIIAFIPTFIDLAYLIVNIVLFITVDTPKQLYNIFTKTDKFHTDVEGYIESIKIQEDSHKVKADIHHEIECESNSVRKVKLLKVERSLEIQIKEIDARLEKLKIEKEKEIKFEVEKLKSDIKNLSKYKDISKAKRLGFYLMLGLGSLILLFPLFFVIAAISDPYWLVKENITGAIILTIMSILFTFIGVFMTRPGRRVLKLKTLNNNLIKLQKS